jgi:hypothetical protein
MSNKEYSLPLLTNSSKENKMEKNVSCTYKRYKRTPNKAFLKQGDYVLAFDIGQTDMAYCLLKYTNKHRPPMEIIDWSIMNIGSGTVTNSVVELCKQVQLQKTWSNVNYVVIEQQARINTKMVAISHALQACLVMFGCADVRFASSACKFSVFHSMPLVTILKPEPKDKSVSQRKKIRKLNSILLTYNIIDGIDVSSDNASMCCSRFSKAGSSTKDDYADSFVYAAAFIYKHEPF